MDRAWIDLSLSSTLQTRLHSSHLLSDPYTYPGRSDYSGLNIDSVPITWFHVLVEEEGGLQSLAMLEYGRKQADRH